ncbi:MAG: DUF3880 domain-containing protein [Lachnospiraceae bacterium]|nr:DUF3880 domain-containing protein [Lachnospiraceae bacterium]
MKILLMDWPGFGCETIKKLLPQTGVETEVFAFPSNDAEVRNGEELGVKIAQKILDCDPDALFSFNYFPVIATAAHACRKKYISWVYDSPASLLYSMTVFFPENHIFHFDSAEAGRMRREGVEHAYYLPLAANTEEYDLMIPTASQRDKYRADIAMIGSMYREERFRIFRKYENFDDYTKGYLEGLIRAQEELYGVNILEGALNDEIMERIMKTVPLTEEHGDSYETAAWTFANYYLAMQVTTREREHVLNALADHYETVVYTPGATPYLPKVKNRGSLDYYREAPLAMKCARINLNITLRSIKNGIPLRIMDILGCGGFLLSNYQTDLAAEFVPGEDFVYYESIEDAVEKAGYYLAHEEERAAIAQNGYRKVKELHSFRVKTEQILETVFGEGAFR